jgi:predicted DNA-binding protein
VKEKKEKVLSFKVEPQHKKKLEVLAHETRRSQSAVIRELIVTAQPDQLLKPTAQLPTAEVVRMSAEAKRKYARELIEAGTRLLIDAESEARVTEGPA